MHGLLFKYTLGWYGFCKLTPLKGNAKQVSERLLKVIYLMEKRNNRKLELELFLRYQRRVHGRQRQKMVEKGEYVLLRVPLCVYVSLRFNGLWRSWYYVRMNICPILDSLWCMTLSPSESAFLASCIWRRIYAALLAFPFLLRGEISLIGKQATDSFQPLMRNSRLLHPSLHQRCSLCKPQAVNFKLLTSS